MNETTGAKVLHALAPYQVKQERGSGRYRCNSPLRPGSNAHAFSLQMDADGEHGAFHDHVSGESGSLYDLAERLGIAPPTPASSPTTKRSYQSLAEYAQAHYTPPEAFQKAGWRETCVKGRLALAFSTATGERTRFLDGAQPVFQSPPGYRACWYGLERACNLAAETGQPLVLCNGEPSVVAAQWHGLAACGITGSGERPIPPDLLDMLRAAYDGPIRVSLDCDAKGRDAARRLAQQLREAGYDDVQACDLGGTDGFDLADFCGLHRPDVAAALAACATLPDITHAPAADGGEQAQERESQAQWLIRVAQDACTLFRTPDGSLYAATAANGHQETWAIGGRGSGLREWLVRQFFQIWGKPPSSNALTGALDVLAALARFSDEVRPVFTRLAYHEGALYLDLCNADWEAVVIDAHGWRVTSTPPVHFRRAKGMLPLPTPQSGGSLHALRGLLNVAGDDDWRLLCGWLLGTLLPPGPADCAHLLLVGEQGSAKSTATRMLRALVDPNEADARPAPGDERDLAIAARNSRVLSFDNLSHLPDWLSDALCRLSTGAAFATRELYSDDGETLFAAKRPCVLNGIADIATRGDLIDRCLIVQLAPIPDAQRRPASAVWQQFEQARPALLGALLDAASAALRNLEQTRIDRLPRLADFALWVEAAAPALGWQPGAFVESYRLMRASSSSTVLEADPLADLLLRFAAPHGWQGTAGALLHDLTARLGDGPPPRWMPKDATRLSGRLKRLAPELRRVGLDVTIERTRRGSLITLAPDKETKGIAASPASHDGVSAHQDAAHQCDAPDEAQRVLASQHHTGVGVAAVCDATVTLCDASCDASVTLSSASQCGGDARDAGDAEQPALSSSTPPCPPDGAPERWARIDWAYVRRLAALPEGHAHRKGLAVHCALAGVPLDVVLATARKETT